jgi:predicted alpha/beta-fold hydrolase
MNEALGVVDKSDSQTDGHKDARATLEAIRRALEMKPFQPHRLFRSGHAQTLAAYAWPRRYLLRRRANDEARLFEVEPNVRVLARCRWQAEPTAHPTIILLHGLEGSSEAAYMLSLAGKAFRAGFNAVRLNMRNCGGTEHLTPTLYNSGMTGDIGAVVRELIERDRLPRIFLAGVSMGGNMVLRYAGELKDGAPRELVGVCAISPAIDLAACAEAIAWRSNWIYQQSFVRSLHRHIRRKQKLYPHLYDTRNLRLVRTVRDFDERYTATHGGYRNADEYYARASSLPVIKDICRPALIIHAQDDPFIPFASFRHSSLSENPYVILIATPRGGHVGFLADPSCAPDRFWAEDRVVEFCCLLLKDEG